MNRLLRALVAPVLLVSVLLIVGSIGRTAAQNPRTFRMMVGEPSSLDPNMVTDFSTYVIVQLFEPMYILRTNGSLQFLGAKSFETSADGLTWTFKLNPAYKWSDGQPVTAADYEFSWKRALDPKLGGAVGDFLLDIKNASEYNFTAWRKLVVAFVEWMTAPPAKYGKHLALTADGQLKLV